MPSITVTTACNRLADQLDDWNQLPAGASKESVKDLCLRNLACDYRESVDSCFRIAQRNVAGWYSSPENADKGTSSSPAKGERNLSTVSICDKKFIDGKIDEDGWKRECFTPGSLNFDNQDELLKTLEDRKTFESYLKGNIFQFSIGTELAGRRALYRDVYKGWNTAAITKENESVMPGAVAQKSNDGVIDQGNQLGARFSFGTGPGLRRFTDTAMGEVTVLDVTIYGEAPLIRLPFKGTALKLDLYHSIWSHSFFNWGFSIADTDPLWQGIYLVSPLHIGFAQQLIGSPIGESHATKAVMGHNDILQNYLLLGTNVFVSFDRSSESDKIGLERSDNRDYFCSKTTSTALTSDHCGFVIGDNGAGVWNAFPKASIGNEFYVNTYVRGELQNTHYGLSYKAHANVYPAWDKVEAGAKATLHVNKGNFRLLLDGSTRKIWTYGDDIYGLPYSAYEYTLQLMLGYYISK